MKFIHILTISGIAILLCIIAVSGSMVIPLSDTGKEHSQAPEYSPAIDENYNLERIDFIHYAKPTGSPGKPAKSPTCYKLMGVSWKSLPVSYVINTTNGGGLTESFVGTAMTTGAETWDGQTSKELFSNSVAIDNNARYGIQDFKNVIAFGTEDADGNPLPENVIAVTSVWWNPRGRQIVEFDMVFNNKWSWGDAGEEGYVMDVQNIATHEMGHAVGLADIYTTTCSAVTMFGYSEEGEISKRTLEQPDIIGLQQMYGA
ncbi:MAG: matrixin family metalloprotease [Methanomicrobiales archaeon]|nr:matrixin family metalloprotease [Methanomicrobiales archaeon]